MLRTSSGRRLIKNAPANVLSEVRINIATAVTTEIVAAVAAKQILVYKLILVAAGVQTVDIKSDTTSLSAVMSMVAGVPLVFDLDDEPWFTAASGVALNFTTTAAVQLSGRIYYLQA